MSDLLTLGVELTTGLLAQDGPRQTGPDFGKASPVGLIAVILLLISVFLCTTGLLLPYICVYTSP